MRLQKDEIVRVLSAPRSLLFYVDPLYLTPDNEAKANGDSQGGAATNPDLVAAVPPKLTGYRFCGRWLGPWGGHEPDRIVQPGTAGLELRSHSAVFTTPAPPYSRLMMPWCSGVIR